jgi:hypothetical protein
MLLLMSLTIDSVEALTLSCVVNSTRVETQVRNKILTYEYSTVQVHIPNFGPRALVFRQRLWKCLYQEIFYLLCRGIETINLCINVVFSGSTILRICSQVRGRKAIQIPASESLRT